MPDDVDLAQITSDANMSAALETMKYNREQALRNPPPCENFDNGCDGRREVLPNKVLARFCKKCLQELKK